METLSNPKLLCPECSRFLNERKTKEKRASAIGKLQPDIVLYHEQDPLPSAISEIAGHDQLLRPDVLLIMVTSITINGVTLLITISQKVIHELATKLAE